MNSNLNAETHNLEQQGNGLSSPGSIVSFLKDLQEGESLLISVKLGDLQSEWKSATATKRPQDFMIKYDDISLKDEVCPFDDKTRSLLSGNLWQIGWFQLRGIHDEDIIQRSIKTTTTPDDVAAVEEIHGTFDFG